MHTLCTKPARVDHQDILLCLGRGHLGGGVMILFPAFPFPMHCVWKAIIGMLEEEQRVSGNEADGQH